MSEGDSLKRKSELEKLLSKLNYISKGLGGKDLELGNIYLTNKGFDTSNIQDIFEKLRVEITFKISETENFIDEKERLEKSTDSAKVQEKYKLENKININLEEIKQKYKEIEVELKSQKKNKKFSNQIQTKEETFKLLGQRYDFLNVKYKLI